MTIYPDASILISAVLRERMSAAAQTLLEKAVACAASEWTLTEVASALAIKQRVGQLMPSDRMQAFVGIRTLVDDGFTVHPVTSAQCRVATSLIQRSALPLRGGDALHLAIADDHRATLWTLDKRMAAAGQALGLNVRLLD